MSTNGPAAAHGHGHPNAGATHRWRLRVAFALVAVFFVVELASALAGGSLSLLSDAGHLAADVVALGAALVATRIASRPDTTGRRTFGSYRAEVFASGLAALLMLGVALYIVVAAVGRIGDEPQVASTLMVVVGLLGLVVNVAALALLRGGAAESLNVKGAYVEVVADTVGSVGVVVAGLLVAATGSSAWDTGIALAIAAFVVVRAVLLGREVLAVLGQHAPAGMVPADAEAALRGVGAVVDIHDLHLWTLTSGMHVATVHLVCDDDADPTQVLTDAAALLRERFAIEHATIQVEPRSARACVETSW
ncbi:MAG TPA: cation diffusion facilitator family transporter [Ornithinibacter sp.]|nr:cation diffusion facilitator family transporter [Ornithinibacter sp.]